MALGAGCKPRRGRFSRHGEEPGRTPGAHGVVHGTGHVPLGNGGISQHVRSANVLVKREGKALAGTARNATGRVVVPSHDQGAHDGTGERASPGIGRHQHRAHLHRHHHPGFPRLGCHGGLQRLEAGRAVAPREGAWVRRIPRGSSPPPSARAPAGLIWKPDARETTSRSGRSRRGRRRGGPEGLGVLAVVHDPRLLRLVEGLLDTAQRRDEKTERADRDRRRDPQSAAMAGLADHRFDELTGRHRLGARDMPPDRALRRGWRG
jgi:hypothetical protein